MLLFQKRFHDGLLAGRITLTFRRWPRARVKAGGRYRCHPIGVLLVDRVSTQRVAALTAQDAKRAGFTSREELVDYLASGSAEPLTGDTELFRVELHHAGEADFVEGASAAELSREDRAEIAKRLRKLDDAASGAWTAKTLKLVAKHPRVAASQLAAKLGRETAPFKADVVKLKKLGLTQSFEVGYDLTPRGRAYLSKPRRQDDLSERSADREG